MSFSHGFSRDFSIRLICPKSSLKSSSIWAMFLLAIYILRLICKSVKITTQPIPDLTQTGYNEYRISRIPDVTFFEEVFNVTIVSQSLGLVVNADCPRWKKQGVESRTDTNICEGGERQKSSFFKILFGTMRLFRFFMFLRLRASEAKRRSLYCSAFTSVLVF